MATFLAAKVVRLRLDIETFKAKLARLSAVEAASGEPQISLTDPDARDDSSAAPTVGTQFSDHSSIALFSISSVGRRDGWGRPRSALQTHVEYGASAGYGPRKLMHSLNGFSPGRGKDAESWL
jgi:hypothetical protein